MGEKTKRILVAVDGSEQSMEVLRFVCASAPRNQTDVVIYQVMSKVPEVFWDLGNDPAWEKKIESLRAWEQQQQANATRFMNSGLELFKASGFAEKNVTTKIGIQKEGIARDIIAETRKGYDAVVIGRGKESAEEGTPLGSVASKIISAANSFPLWLIGGKPNSAKVLVAMDSSEWSLRAVDHAGSMLNHDSNIITLFHAIRGISVSSESFEDIFPEAYCKQLIGDAEREIQPALQVARGHLEEMAVAPNRVSTKIITSVKSRAAAIVQEARENGYGTIVVGRRGMTEVAEFDMGRVANKLTQLAKTQALCIIA